MTTHQLANDFYNLLHAATKIPRVHFDHLRDIGVITDKRMFYALIYDRYECYLEDGERPTDAMTFCAEDFCVSERTAQRAIYDTRRKVATYGLDYILYSGLPY